MSLHGVDVENFLPNIPTRILGARGPRIVAIYMSTLYTLLEDSEQEGPSDEKSPERLEAVLSIHDHTSLDIKTEKSFTWDCGLYLHEKHAGFAIATCILRVAYFYVRFVRVLAP